MLHTKYVGFVLLEIVYTYFGYLVLCCAVLSCTLLCTLHILDELLYYFVAYFF